MTRDGDPTKVKKREQFAEIESKMVDNVYKQLIESCDLQFVVTS